MTKSEKSEQVAVNWDEMDMVVEGLNLIQSDVKKLVTSAEKKKREDMAKVGRDAILKIEDLKSKFLHAS